MSDSAAIAGWPSAILHGFTADMERSERLSAMGWYIRGLLLDGDRKSMQPMAARLVDDSEAAEALRQRLQHQISESSWDEREMFRRLARKVDADLPGAEALIVDDTGFPK